MRRTAGVLVGLLLLTACGGDDEGSADGDPASASAAEGATTTAEETTTTAEQAAEVPLPAGAPVVELVDPGAEPRRALRFDPVVGEEQRITLRQEQTQVIEAGGVEQSTSSITELDVAYVVEDVGDGVIRTRAVYEDARIVEADAAARPVLERILGQFVGAEGRTEFDARGYVLDAELPDLDLGGIPGAEQILEGLEGQLTSTAVPFPDEPVGAGAVWTVTSSTEFAGILVADTSFTVTLDSVDEEEVVASMVVTMTFSSAGAALEVESGELSGSGTTTWPLGGVLALSDQQLTGTVVFTTQGQQVTQHQEQRITLTAR